MREILQIACVVALFSGLVYSMRPDRGFFQELFHAFLIVGGMTGLLFLEVDRRISKRREADRVDSTESGSESAFSAKPLAKPIPDVSERPSWQGDPVANRWRVAAILVVFAVVALFLYLNGRQ
jgi:hypothetical protein